MFRQYLWEKFFKDKAKDAGEDEYVHMPTKRIRGAGVVEVSARDLLKSKKVQQHFEIAKRLVDNQARLDRLAAEQRKTIKQAG